MKEEVLKNKRISYYPFSWNSCNGIFIYWKCALDILANAAINWEKY
jgi:hypothetical protein